MSGGHPGLQRGDGAPAGEHSRRVTVLPSLDRCAGPCGALPSVQPAVSVRTQLNKIPSQVPYLKVDPARIAHWRERLEATLPPRLKRIGLAWTGRPTHPNDRRRSMALAQLAPLVVPARPHSYRCRSQCQRVTCPPCAVPWLDDSADDLTDFGETAAVVENLDLIITVDTSMGHLAGALGKPAWILIPKAADWRWMLEREDSPWYPSVRLFRQPKPGTWDEPLDRLRAALSRELAGSRAEGFAAN